MIDAAFFQELQAMVFRLEDMMDVIADYHDEHGCPIARSAWTELSTAANYIDSAANSATLIAEKEDTQNAD